MSTGILPKQTIYIKNLYEKLGVKGAFKLMPALHCGYLQPSENRPGCALATEPATLQSVCSDVHAHLSFTTSALVPITSFCLSCSPKFAVTLIARTRPPPACQLVYR